jgi:predicted AAA+ superfamily ATPase
MYPRKLYPWLKEHLSQKQMTVITGMRRTGKTTLLKQLLADIPSNNKIYIDLERIDNREIFSEKNYEAVIYALRQRGLDVKEKVYAGLDEIQLVKGLPSVLKYLYDNDNYEMKFILTGSSSYYLKDLFTESLAGRKKVFELYPLDFGEFLTFKEIPYLHEIQVTVEAEAEAEVGARAGKALPFFKRAFSASEYERLKDYYEEFIAYGGFPEVVLTSVTQEKKDLLSDILSSYINIDVKTLADFRNQENLYKLMKMLAARSGSRLDYVKLSRLTGISRLTIYNYMEFLEKTYIIRRIPVLAKNPDREIVKAQKLYFYDNGILNLLADVSSGVKFENALFTQLHHWGKSSLSYYALKTGREIDFILDHRLALEAKESPTALDKEALSKLADGAGIKAFRLIGRYPVPHFNDYVWGGEIR